MKKHKIFSLCINEVTKEEALKVVLEAALARKNFFACFANTHMVIEAYKNSQTRNEISKASLILPDGWPVAKSMSIFNKYDQARIAGMDFIFDILKLANEYSMRVFLFGGTEGMLDKATTKVKENYPGLTLAGSISPPFNGGWDSEGFIDKINASNTNLVLVALGCPKQELWMAENYQKVSAPMLGLGAAIPVFAGVMPRCPKWLRDNGFEWVYRLVQEPRRLFMRYFTSNFHFVYLFVKTYILMKFGIRKIDKCN